MDMEVFGLSVVTDMGDEENIEEVNHAEVLKAAEKAEPAVRKLIKELISRY
jgi:purine-nucleoside phosphorylase